MSLEHSCPDLVFAVARGKAKAGYAFICEGVLETRAAAALFRPLEVQLFATCHAACTMWR